MERPTHGPSESSPEGYACPHELQAADMSGKGNWKSCCDLTVAELGHATWTNCRTFGKCTLAGDVL